VVTNRDAPNNKVLLIDPAHPEMENYKELISEKVFKLESVSSVGGKLYCNYLVNACSKIQVHDFNGALIHTVELPGLGSAGGFGGKSTDSTTYFSFSSFNMPPSIYEYHPNTNQSILYKATKLNYPLLPTVVEQLWFTSKDGTKVPMFVFHRSDVSIENNKPQPTLMYGYGGFNIPKTPEFSVQTMYFVQQGGVYVMVNLRGGSEFGELWHQGGMLEKKQNVFDDFIGAAECLIQKGITSKDKLAVNGRSNGGLLVGACMTQRPDLFKVAIPTVGVLDMLRYHKFTIGWGWAVEYGRSDKQEDFNYLIKYSPLHNIHANTVYPATLITTGDHDDRVVPAHSFKFAATLQAANLSVNPILIRVDTQAGHGAGKPITKLIDEWSDIISFTMYHLGMTIPK
jgi:prolyl oligopeptidase